MNLFGIDIGLLFKLKKVKDAVDKETKNGFSWALNGKKAALNFAIFAGATAAVAVLNALEVPANLALFFQWLPESVRTLALGLLAPAIASAVISARNWFQKRLAEIQWVVPIEKPSANVMAGYVPPKLTGAAPVAIVVVPAVPPATTPTVPIDAGA